MSALWAPIDHSSLEEELHAALAADELYKLQNDAKLRAVEQGVPTYEHFRQMVIDPHYPRDVNVYQENSRNGESDYAKF